MAMIEETAQRAEIKSVEQTRAEPQSCLCRLFKDIVEIIFSEGEERPFSKEVVGVEAAVTRDFEALRTEFSSALYRLDGGQRKFVASYDERDGVLEGQKALAALICEIR